MKISRITVVMAAAGCLLVSTAWAQGQQARDEQQMKAYIDMMRKDLRTEKQSVVDKAMGLEAGDKAKFWAVYDKYQGEVKALWDQRLANVKKYADNYEKMTDAIADEIAAKSMDVDSQRVAIRKKYFGEMKAALGARAAARFLQTEAMLDHLIELQIGAEIPLIP
jgi:uncharacterized Fe-S center protein